MQEQADLLAQFVQQRARRGWSCGSAITRGTRAGVEIDDEEAWLELLAQPAGPARPAAPRRRREW